MSDWVIDDSEQLTPKYGDAPPSPARKRADLRDEAEAHQKAWDTRGRKDGPSKGELQDALDEGESLDDYKTWLTDHGVRHVDTVTSDVGRQDPVYAFTLHGQRYVLEDGGDRITPAEEWLNRVNDPEDWVDVGDFNKDFWESPGSLYHGTTEDHAESIDTEGLNAENQTRGITNRSIGSSVFTTDNPEVADQYGDVVYEIDFKAMKRDGMMPHVEREPGANEADAYSALADRLGLEDYQHEDIDPAAADPSTVIVGGHIPKKYIRRLSIVGEGDLWFALRDEAEAHRKQWEVRRRKAEEKKAAARGDSPNIEETPEAGLGKTKLIDRAVVAGTVERGKVDGLEHGVITNGKIVELQGDEYALRIPAEARAGWDDRANHFTVFHNHPIIAALSRPDMSTLQFNGVDRIVAITHEGDRFEASRGPKYLAPSPQIEERLRSVGDKAYKWVGLRAEDIVGVGGLANISQQAKEKIAISQHAAALSLATLGVIRYRYNLKSPAMKAADAEAHVLAAKIVEDTKRLERRWGV